MRNALLGTVAGLLVGTLGALAYTHFNADSESSDLQARLDAANADLARLKAEKSRLAQETTGTSSEVDQLQASNTELKKELDDAKAAAPAVVAPPPPINPMMLAGMVMGMVRGGGMQPQQRLFLLQNRLKLTPDQNAKIKAALDADAKSRGEAMRAMFRNGGKSDPNAPPVNLNSLDKVLADTLTPQQKTQYAQVQSDEKASRAETAATVQLNQMAPLMQFNDTQKEQVLNTLYTVQNSAPDPTSLIGNPDAMTAITKQAQATQDALAKVLTPDQLALYQQQAAMTPQFGGGFGRRNGNGGGNGAGGNGGGGNAPPTANVPTPAASGATPSGNTFAGQTGTPQLYSPSTSATTGTATNAAPTTP